MWGENKDLRRRVVSFGGISIWRVNVGNSGLNVGNAGVRQPKKKSFKMLSCEFWGFLIYVMCLERHLSSSVEDVQFRVEFWKLRKLNFNTTQLDFWWFSGHVGANEWLLKDMWVFLEICAWFRESGYHESIELSRCVHLIIIGVCRPDIQNIAHHPHHHFIHPNRVGNACVCITMVYLHDLLELSSLGDTLAYSHRSVPPAFVPCWFCFLAC